MDVHFCFDNNLFNKISFFVQLEGGISLTLEVCSEDGRNQLWDLNHPLEWKNKKE